VTGRGAVAAIAGGLGLVALVVVTATVGAVALVALGLPATGRADDAPSAPVALPLPTELVVALSPGDLSLQAGVVRGRDVILARGFEVEVVRAVAERLGIPRVRFVYVGAPERLLASGQGRWHLAVASLRPSRSIGVSHTTPYLATDQVVLLRRGTARPRGLADLRTRILCAMRSTEAARAAALIRPAEPVVLAPTRERLAQLVQTGACDAALIGPVEATSVLEGRKALLGPFAARVPWGGGLVIAVRPGSGIEVSVVDRALARLRSDGTLDRLARFWLGLDPASLPLLR
jgi:ABC-type amino acid transport substrate-binding protein